MPARPLPAPAPAIAHPALPLLRLLLAAGSGALLLALAAPAAGAQQRTGDPLRWSGALRSGAHVRVASMKGAVRVEPASGGTLEVVAEPRDDRRRREPLRLDVVEHADGVTICVLTAERRCSADGLDDEGRGWSWRGDDYAATDVTVRLPRGASLAVSTGNGAVEVQGTEGEVRASSGNGAVTLRGVRGAVRASTGNGAVTVDGVQGEVQASTGNGRVTVTTASGPVRASTGNGDVQVRMASLRDAGDMRFSTGNGRVTVHLPASFSGTLDLNTGRGDAVTDFPIQVSGRLRRNTVRGTVGDGRGPTVRIRSGNGDVEVRRGGA